MLCRVILFDRLSSLDIFVYLNDLNHEIIRIFYKTVLVIKYETQGQAKRLLQKKILSAKYGRENRIIT